MIEYSQEMAETAAPTLSKKQLAQTFGGRQKKPFLKTVLCSPYDVKWPSVQNEQKILTELQSVLGGMNLHKPAAGWKKGGLWRKMTLQQRQKAQQDAWADLPPNTASIRPISHLPTPLEPTLRSKLVFGVNRVTRCLERGELQLVLVDRSSPWQLHRHLIQLCVVKQCPGMAVKGLAETVGPLISVDRLAALGFRVIDGEPSEELMQLVASLSAQCPDMSLPWTTLQEELVQLPNVQPGRSTDDISVATSSEFASSTRCRSRDTDGEYESADYSHLYVFKTEMPQEPRDGFIKFNSNDDDDGCDDDIQESVLGQPSAVHSNEERMVNARDESLDELGKDSVMRQKVVDAKRTPGPTRHRPSKKRKLSVKNKPKKNVYEKANIKKMQPNSSRVSGKRRV